MRRDSRDARDLRLVGLAPASLAAGAILLGHALQLKRGLYTPAALVWLLIALVLVVGGTLALRERSLAERTARTLLWIVIAAGIVWQVFDLARSWPVLYAPRTTSRAFFRGAMLVEALWLAAGIVNLRSLRRVWFPAVIVIHLAIGIWALHVSPSPRIDVVAVHDAAIDALRAGHSPYHLEYENVYGPRTSFAAGPLVNGRVHAGYPYPPLTLLLVAPFRIFLGDYRLGLLAAMVLTVVMIGYGRPDSMAKLAAALLLTQPRGLFVLEQGWTEPVVLVLLAALLVVPSRRAGAWAWIIGSVLVTKQYLVFGVPFFGRLIVGRRDGLRLLAFAAAAAALVTVPFLVWDFNGFVQNGLLSQTYDAFRGDSLSILSWAAQKGWGEGSMLWAIGAGTAIAIVCWFCVANTLAGAYASLAATTMLSFTFGWKAFANYYFFVIGVVCCAIVAALPSMESAGGTAADRAVTE